VRSTVHVPVRASARRYWDIYDPSFVAQHMAAPGGAAPGHACEYETSTMLHLWPERVSVADSA
jgi:creatinine amidohydrolase/Fe(II)-dependent formamide hydrolase-like protein